MIYPLRSHYPKNMIKFIFIKEKTDINQKDYNFKKSPLINAILNYTQENLIRLLRNEKTEINKKIKKEFFL